MADARVQHMRPLRKDVYAAAGFAAQFHAQVEEWQDRDDITPKETETLQFTYSKDKRSEKALS